MYSMELEQEYLYDNKKYIVCCTLDYTVTGQYLVPTAEEPAEYPEIEVTAWSVDAILIPCEDTIDSKTTMTERKLSFFDPLYEKIEKAFVLDDDWFLQSDIQEKLVEDYDARLKDTDY